MVGFFLRRWWWRWSISVKLVVIAGFLRFREVWRRGWRRGFRPVWRWWRWRWLVSFLWRRWRIVWRRWWRRWWRPMWRWGDWRSVPSGNQLMRIGTATWNMVYHVTAIVFLAGHQLRRPWERSGLN
jgi:hypothetical protein